MPSCAYVAMSGYRDMAVACPNMKLSEKRTLLTQIRDLMASELEDRLNALSSQTPPDGEPRLPASPARTANQPPCDPHLSDC